MTSKEIFWKGLFFALALSGLALWAGLAGAQQGIPPVATWPVVTTSSNVSSTITSAGTYQSVFAASALRRGCTVQDNGTHTMYVFFGPIASATHGNSVQLTQGQSVSCQAGGIVLTDQVSVDGTTADAFYAAQQ